MLEYLKIAADIVGVLALLFYGGRFVGRIEAAVSRLGKLEELVAKIPVLETRVNQTAEFLRHFVESVHPKMADDMKDVEVELAVLKRTSQVDQEERNRR